MNKVTNNYAKISKKFKNKQLEMQKGCNNLEQTKDFKRNNTVELTQLVK